MISVSDLADLFLCMAGLHVGCEMHQSGRRSEQPPKDAPEEGSCTTTIHPKSPSEPLESRDG